jgi:hypothetical protein
VLFQQLFGAVGGYRVEVRIERGATLKAGSLDLFKPGRHQPRLAR